MTAFRSPALLFFTGFVLALCGASSTRAGSPAPVLSLNERIILLQQSGSDREDKEITLWQGRIKASLSANQGAAGNYERLGWAYISKARRTLDPGYYKLAEKTADAMDARFGQTNEALLLRGSVYHNLHRFADAEQVARSLVAKRGIAFDYALLSDALMEQGKLMESVAACEKMMALKPGVDAYSRAANLRWLTGDLPGAIVAMEAAVRAGSPIDATNTAWTLARLSNYYLQAGRLSDALRTSEMAEGLVADYPPALLARGRALLALGQNAKALAPLKAAEKLNPLPEYQWWLADALRAGGDPNGASKIEAEMKARGEAADPRTFSLYLASRGEDPADAIRLATAELSNRDDVFTKDALAWALESGGHHVAAAATIKDALTVQTKDARLFLHAGEIAESSGNAVSAKTFFDQAEQYSATLTPSEKALLELRLRQQGEALPPRST
jgi:tetratricopeptide (TPR) repeat protein